MKTKPILVILIVLFVVVNLIILGIILFERGLFGSTSEVSPDFAENINLLENTNSENANISQNTNVSLNTNSSNNTNVSQNTNAFQNVNLSQNTNSSQNINASAGTATTYTSTGLGLSLDIPSIFHLTSVFNAQDTFLQAETYDESQYTYTEEPVDGLKLEIYMQENPESLTLMDWIAQNQFSEQPSINLSNTMVGGEPALEDETLTKIAAERSIYISRASKVYIIAFSGGRSYYDGHLEIVNNLINSITFIK